MEAQATTAGRPSDTVVKLTALLDVLAERNRPVRYSLTRHRTYETARAVLMFFAVLWWLLVVAGLLVLASGLSTAGANSFEAVALSRILVPAGAIMSLAGLIGVQQNQTARAVVDTADYARQHLELVALAWGVETEGGRHGPHGLL